MMIVLAVAGCSRPGAGEQVATAGGTAGAKPSASVDGPALSEADQQLRFARCMRENGIDVPDPVPGGQNGTIRVGGGNDAVKVKAAVDACRSFLPNGGQVGKLDPEQAENMRRLAQCLRENGIPDFPDPAPDGSLKIDPGVFGSKDLNDPTLKAAMQKCQQYLPKLAGGGK
ncbi:hypothetical protein GCM10027290_36450 [Micromonospora sonneratiae]